MDHKWKEIGQQENKSLGNTGLGYVYLMYLCKFLTVYVTVVFFAVYI